MSLPKVSDFLGLDSVMKQDKVVQGTGFSQATTTSSVKQTLSLARQMDEVTSDNWNKKYPEISQYPEYEFFDLQNAIVKSNAKCWCLSDPIQDRAAYVLWIFE